MMPAPAPRAPGCPALLPSDMGGRFPKHNLPTGAWLPDRGLHLPWKRANGIRTLAQAAGDCLHGDTMFPWGPLGTQTTTLGRAALLRTQAPSSPPAPRAELAASSKPEVLLQEVSSDAGISLADFKDLLEMS